MREAIKIEISLRNILAIIAMFAIGFFALQIWGVIAMFFIAYIISAGLRPIIDMFQNRLSVPRGLSVGLIYAFGIVILFIIFVLIANQFITQAVNLFTRLPEIFANLLAFINERLPILNSILPLEQLQTELTEFVKQALQSPFVSGLLSGENFFAVINGTFNIFGSVGELLIGLVTIVMLSIYMSLSKEKFYTGLITLLSPHRANRLQKVLVKVEESLGSWLVGQFSLMFIIGSVTYAIVSIPAIFDPNYRLVDFALPIALIAGLLEAVPNIGPAITTLIAGVLAIGTSGLSAFLYIVLSFGILQNLEGVFIVPNVMKRAVGLHPIVTIVGIISAFKLLGVLGAILVVPALTVVHIFLQELIKADLVPAVHPTEEKEAKPEKKSDKKEKK